MTTLSLGDKEILVHDNGAVYSRSLKFGQDIFLLAVKARVKKKQVKLLDSKWAYPGSISASGDTTLGCQTITWKELRRFARVMKWI